MTTRTHAITLMILIVVGLTGLTSAQTSTTLKAQVPFDFVVNHKAISAGECTIAAVVANGQTLLSIRSGKQHVFVLPRTSSQSTGKQAALVFHKYGDSYFLAALKREGKIDYQLPVGKLERELQARNLGEQVLTLLASAE